MVSGRLAVPFWGATCPDSAALEQPKRPRRRLSGPEILHRGPVPGHGRFGSS